VFPSAPAPALVDAIVAAEELGVDEFWLGDEGVARDPFSTLAAAAVRTRRIFLGVAVTNPYLRHPVTIAAEAMTVHELAQGRMILGLGPGGQMALGPAQVERTRPFRTVQQALRTIRAVTRGVEDAGYTPPLDAFTAGLPIHIGSRSERFQRLASAEADGAFLGGLPASTLPTVVGWARSLRPIDIGVYSTGVFDADEARELPARMIMPLADSPDHVLDTLRLDRARVVDAAAAFSAGDPRAAAAIVTPAVFDDLVLSGTPAAVGRRLAERARALRPTTVGLTFTSRDPLAVVQASAEAFATLDKELS
jgi:5,10-methylenetetrahydromethanopterin reductase